MTVTLAASLVFVVLPIGSGNAGSDPRPFQDQVVAFCPGEADRGGGMSVEPTF